MSKFAEKHVCWGIPDPEELEDAESPPGSPPKSPGASYVYRKEKSLIDIVSETNPVPVWEGSVYKKRRIRGGWVCVHFVVAATCRVEGDHKEVQLSFNYRDHFHDPLQLKMRGHIDEILNWSPDDINSLPVSGCGLIIACVTDDGRHKVGQGGVGGTRIERFESQPSYI
jgi:hypothetical protein